MTEIDHAKVTSKLQITIPKKVQKELGGLKGGQYIIFNKEGRKIYITKGKVEAINK